MRPQRTIQALLRALAEEKRAITLLLDDYHLAVSSEMGFILGSVSGAIRAVPRLDCCQQNPCGLAVVMLESKGLGG